MEDKIKKDLQDILNFNSDSETEIEEFRVKYLGKKGLLNSYFVEFKSLESDEKKKLGSLLNELKNSAQQKVDNLKSNNSKKSDNLKINDISRPGDPIEIGSRHPISIVKNRIIDIFSTIGFTISEGPEIEDDWHNFSALNLPEHHPARDMQDTFFIDPETVLRTHTSNVQVHLMEEQDPPIRYIVPGRVYRNEAIGYKSYCLFHQVEGIYINERVSFGELKGCLEYFVKQMFGPKKKMRFRPSFFPFTEPSAEVDIWDEERQQWMEILGCGMVDPAVLDNVGYDSSRFHGYAFGMGVERIAMLKYKISDIRHFYSGDVRFMEQFV